ncbi:hypothetical protein GTQ40_06280 [Flavobacteriaceae bacterium R38]|nr:hypothetical protein [Flavobacteriaceae bacterium R38]
MNALIRLLILFLLSLFINIKPAKASDQRVSEQVIIDYKKVDYPLNTLQIKKEKVQGIIKQQSLENRYYSKDMNHKE